MSEPLRLNGAIRALEQGLVTFSTFVSPDIQAAIGVSTSKYDCVVFEAEHNPYDITAIRDSLQYMLNRAEIVRSGSIAPAVTPLVRIPSNGDEKNQFLAKQALDIGAYGIVWPHISTVDQAYNAVGACRYPRLKSASLYEPAGLRGDGPFAAARYWGLSQLDYYKKADVWPLAPDGEILCALMIEDTVGISNLGDMLENVPGIGLIVIGQGDLSQELGHPREYAHPEVHSAMMDIVSICKAHGVAVGHPIADDSNTQRLLDEGFTFLMSGPNRSFATLESGMKLAGRA